MRAIQRPSGFGKAEKIIHSGALDLSFPEFPFWESGATAGIPLPPPNLWNHRFTGKTQNNLWGSRSCRQNLEPHGLSSIPLSLLQTAFALAMICSLKSMRKVRCHMGL